MDLRYTDDEQPFRAELRDWLADGPARPSARPRTRTTGPPPGPTTRPGSACCSTPGYAGINWPKEYGGRGATPAEHLIFLEETERAGAPYVGMNFVGLLHAGPTLIAEASDEQKAFHLPGILKGEHVLVPGLLRAQRRLRPRQPPHAGPCATATTT